MICNINIFQMWKAIIKTRSFKIFTSFSFRGFSFLLGSDKSEQSGHCREVTSEHLIVWKVSKTFSTWVRTRVNWWSRGVLGYFSSVSCSTTRGNVQPGWVNKPTNQRSCMGVCGHTLCKQGHACTCQHNHFAGICQEKMECKVVCK